MASDRQPRYLAAILYADVVGFSRMSEADEEGTFLKVRDYLDNFASIITRNNGEVIKYAGDAVLAIFSSATDALICAAQVQASTAERNRGISDDDQVRFRIGLNLGDIIKDRGDVFGDGVNVAARLEALAKPAGICVSGSFYDAIAMKLPFDFEFMGDQQVKNISKPIRAYHAKLQDGADISASQTSGKDHLPSKVAVSRKYIIAVAALFIIGSGIVLSINKPRQPDNSEITVAKAEKQKPGSQKLKPNIIILPFKNLSDNSDQEYFADGITDDIITDLSRLSNLDVMARNTSFRYKENPENLSTVGKDLGVTHILEGTVRKFGNQIRINVQLTDTTNYQTIWSERYDRKLDDVFAVQDDLARNIVGQLSLELTDIDKKLLSHTTTNNAEAYNIFLKGLGQYRIRSKESLLQAIDLFNKAISLDPEYARAYGALSLAITSMVNIGWSDSPNLDRDRALEVALKATELDPKSQQAFWALGFTRLFRKEINQAKIAVQKAIDIAPSYADAYGMMALINNFQGNPQEAIRLINKAKLLNPHYSWDYPYNLGRAYYTLGDYKKANELLEEALNRNPNARVARQVLAASYAALGMQDEAEWEADQLLTQYPALSISFLNNEIPLENEQLKKSYFDHLRQAGIPE